MHSVIRSDANHYSKAGRSNYKCDDCDEHSLKSANAYKLCNFRVK